jgi:hypothetical protein
MCVSVQHDAVLAANVRHVQCVASRPCITVDMCKAPVTDLSLQKRLGGKRTEDTVIDDAAAAAAAAAAAVPPWSSLRPAASAASTAHMHHSSHHARLLVLSG